MSGENQEKEAYPTLQEVSTKSQNQMFEPFPMITLLRSYRQELPSEISLRFAAVMLVVSRAGEAYDTQASGLN